MRKFLAITLFLTACTSTDYTHTSENSSALGHHEGSAPEGRFVEAQRLPPEYAPSRAVLLAPDLMPPAVLEQLTRSFAAQGKETWIAYGVPATVNRDYLRDPAIWPRLRLFKTDAYLQPWIRDYGPLSTLSLDDRNYLRSAELNYDTQPTTEDTFPRRFADSLSIHNLSMPRYGEGGNLMINGRSECVVTSKFITDDARYTGKHPGDFATPIDDNFSALRDYLGCRVILVLGPIHGEGTGHIDMSAKFADDDNVIVSTLDQAIIDQFLSFAEDFRLLAMGGEVVKMFARDPHGGLILDDAMPSVGEDDVEDALKNAEYLEWYAKALKVIQRDLDAQAAALEQADYTVTRIPMLLPTLKDFDDFPMIGPAPKPASDPEVPFPSPPDGANMYLTYANALYVDDVVYVPSNKKTQEQLKDAAALVKAELTDFWARSFAPSLVDLVNSQFVEQYESEAGFVYRRFSDRVVQVNSDQHFARKGGDLHCVTMQVPVGDTCEVPATPNARECCQYQQKEKQLADVASSVFGDRPVPAELEAQREEAQAGIARFCEEPRAELERPGRPAPARQAIADFLPR